MSINTAAIGITTSTILLMNLLGMNHILMILNSRALKRRLYMILSMKLEKKRNLMIMLSRIEKMSSIPGELMHRQVRGICYGTTMVQIGLKAEDITMSSFA